MITPRFLQIHTLHSYAGVLLNRGQDGRAKQLTFGGVPRTRVSSQSLKRHWRVAEGKYAIHSIEGAEKAVRSRNTIDEYVGKSLIGCDEKIVKEIVTAFNKGVYGEKGNLQPLLLGMPEIAYLQKKAVEIVDSANTEKEAKEMAEELFSRKGENANFKAFREVTRLPGGLEGALFGRMITSDIKANIDAAIHVSHMFTVHAMESETDFFTVVDDVQHDDAGAAHMGEVEIDSGIFYSYVVVDVPKLISNLEGTPDWENADKRLASKVVEYLVHLIATVSTGAKLGSTAPYSRAAFLLIEAGPEQPRTLADAFRIPVRPRMDDALTALANEIKNGDIAYEPEVIRRFMSTQECVVPGGTRLSLPGVARWAEEIICDGSAE